MKFETPIFDRTLEHVNSLKILLEKGYKNFTEKDKISWESNLKGALNISDLNRIENNISVIAEILNTTLTSKTNWKETDIPIQSDFLRIQSNLLNLRSKLSYILDDVTPKVPNLPFNYYTKINDIEKILFDIYNLLLHQEQYYCGEGTETSQIEIYSGENIGIL